jgi:hypothetical protein
MPDAAHITSTDAIDAFRNALVVYLERARRLVDEVEEEVTHTRQWLQTDQRVHWQREIKTRTRKLESAKRDLHRARLDSLRGSTELQTRDVRRTKASLEEAEAKLRVVKQWEREFDRTVARAARPLEQFRGILDIDMGHAVTQLARTLETLAAYSETGPSAAAPPTESDDEH